MLIAWIDEIQKRNHVTGDVFEIGCHMGKSAVFLGAMISPPDEAFRVCDIFDDQTANTSESGEGCRTTFDKNIRRHLGTGIEVKVFQRKSNTLTSGDVGRQYRLFHVDGGHNTEEALFDLELGARSTIEHGVIVLDDPFRPEWPGVTEALIRFLDAYEEFRAVAVGFNKLVLSRKSHSELYASRLRNRKSQRDYGLGYPWHTKELDFHGSPLQIFYMPSYLAGRRFSVIPAKLHERHGLLPRLRRVFSLLSGRPESGRR